MKEVSYPSWQQHRTGYCWLPFGTLPVAPLWCDLGRCSPTVVVIKLLLASALMKEDHTDMISFSNCWNLHNFWLTVSPGYKHDIKVNVCGGTVAPVSFILFPSQTEFYAVHAMAYQSMLTALCALSAVRTCNNCYCCKCITNLLSDAGNVHCVLHPHVLPALLCTFAPLKPQGWR